VLANLTHPVAGFDQPQVLDDVVYEVDTKGGVVWTWTASEHIEEFGFAPDELKLVRASKSADYLHVNDLKPVGPNHWFDAGDKRFDPDNLIFDSRNANFIAIIDRKTGKIVWTLGPHFPAIPETGTATNRGVPRPVDQISGQHDAQVIPAGLPGAGNILLFDNQGEGGYPPAPLTVTGGSRILEIDPVRKEIVWQYTGAEVGPRRGRRDASRRAGPQGVARAAAVGAARLCAVGRQPLQDSRTRAVRGSRRRHLRLLPAGARPRAAGTR
jgi:hypothetical protein